MTAAESPPLGERLKRISALDAAMLTLAVVSVAALSYEAWGPVDDLTRRYIRYFDYTVCAVFFVEFMWRWRGVGWRANFIWRNWYEILGMIPVTHPALRGFRLLRVVRIVVVLARVGYAADRALGEDFTYRLVNRFRDSIVDALRGAVTLAVIDEVADVLEKGQYTRNVLRAFDQNRPQLQQMTVEKLRGDPQVRRLSRLPFYNDLVERLVAAVLRVIRDFLADPRTDLLVADILSENLSQIRAAVVQKERIRNENRPGGDSASRLSSDSTSRV